jgi:hypothetical protein
MNEADVRAAVANEIATAIESLDVPNRPSLSRHEELTSDRALGFFVARGMAAAIARAHGIEGGRHPQNMVDVVTGGGV